METTITTGGMMGLAIALLDDPHGISSNAYQRLLENYGDTTDLPTQLLFSKVRTCEGRHYLPEDWND